MANDFEMGAAVSAIIIGLLAMAFLAAACSGDRSPKPAEPTSAQVTVPETPIVSSTSVPTPIPTTAPPENNQQRPCADRVLNVGFYAYFAPVSYSADADPASDGFNTHLGYEADLLNALEAMLALEVSFSRHGVGAWDDIWLLSAGPDYDLIGGGITVLDSRTRDSSGEAVVRFTSGHITFRQSLLVRAADAERFASHDGLTSDVRVGALADTTGEARLLVLTGLVDAAGVLAAGVRVETRRGAVVADGSADYFITAAGESANLEGRRSLHPSSEAMPQVIYLGDETGEAELLEALGAGTIDALARGEIGNRDAARISNGGFVVTALDEAAEHGGFTLDIKDAELAVCLDEKINWLTDNRRIGYREWLEAPDVFIRRAQQWNNRS